MKFCFIVDIIQLLVLVLCALLFARFYSVSVQIVVLQVFKLSLLALFLLFDVLIFFVPVFRICEA